jgi:putative ABC transport system ATP-binding protein
MIEARNIKKSFVMGSQSLQVLQDVSLTVRQGEFVSLMGPSGSGKSTLLYILGGLDRADSGMVMVNGKEMDKMNDDEESVMRLYDIGFVFQAYNLIENLTLEENVLLPAMIGGKQRKDILPWLDELLHTVGIAGHRAHRPVELSGGEQQRTAIARALINRPRVIFADEPTGNLDSRNGIEVLKLLAKVNQEYGITILMVTHSEESALYGNRVIKLKDGQLA